MATLSAEQFQALLATITNAAAGITGATIPGATKNDPAALGPIRQCALGTDKMRKLTIFDAWLEEAENRMAYIGITSDAEKIILLKTWGGPDITELIKLEQSNLNIKTEYSEGGDQATNTTYSQLTQKLRTYLSKLVNRTMAMHQLLTTQQGSRNWSDFIRDLETKAKILDFEKKPYTIQEAIKDAAIFGMTDAALKEKALAEDPDLEKLTRWGQAREAGREDAHHLKGSNIRKIGSQRDAASMSASMIDDMTGSLQAMKLRKAGKYSARNKDNKPLCQRCSTQHPPERCPANGKTCFECGGRDHFAKAKICPKKSIHRLKTDTHNDTHMKHISAEVSYWGGEEEVNKSSNARRVITLRKVENRPCKQVDVKVGGEKMRLFADTGSDFTIISPSDYTASMGPLRSSDISIRE